MHTHAHIHTYAHTYKHMNTHVHTYTHMNTHTHTTPLKMDNICSVYILIHSTPNLTKV